MPKDTFNHLPEDKRARVLNAAVELFSQKGFQRTDVAHIAQKAGVAKGSIYNYFNNKEELYLHVCRVGLRMFRDVVYGDLSDDRNVYEQVNHTFVKGAEFTRNYPAHVKLYLNVSSAGMERFAEELSPEVETYFADRFKKLIGQGIADGTVRPDIDANLAAFMINSLFMTFVVSPVSKHHSIRMEAYFDSNESSYDERLSRVIGLIEDFLKPGR